MGAFIIGIILVLVGLSFLTGIPVVGFIINFIIAIVLITIGVRIIMRGTRRGDWTWRDAGRRKMTDENEVDEVAIFSDLNRAYTSERFAGGKIVMVFSGGLIDLTSVRTDAAAVDLDVSVVFSSIEVVIPKEWTVRSEVASVMGSVDLYGTEGGGEAGYPTFTIRGEAVLGEVRVRK